MNSGRPFRRNDRVKRLTLLALALVAAATACTAFREGMEGHRDAVARAEGYTLTVEHAAQLLAAAPAEIAPTQVAAVGPLTDLWIGYTLLATQFASPDTFNDVDLTPLIRLSADQELVWQLRDDVILARVDPSEAELRSAYEREQPYTRVAAQHILIRVPTEASPAQADSLRLISEGLRRRALAGEEFARLARQYSEDPVSAPQGGELGWVRRGRLVPELDRVVFRLQPDEISETVRSPFGYHILKVTQREVPDFESVRDEYALSLVGRDAATLETVYIDSLFRAARVRYAHGSVRWVKGLAMTGQLPQLSPAQREAALVRYRGGRLTLGEWADFVMRNTPRAQQAFAGSDSASVAQLLRELVRNELLARAARQRGYSVEPATLDSLQEMAKRELATAAAVSGLHRDRLASGAETVPAAVDRAIREVLTRQRSPQPLARVVPALRPARSVQLYRDRFPAVVQRLAELRGAKPGRRGGERASPGLSMEQDG